MKHRTKHYLASLTGLALASAAFAWACGDSDKNTEPTKGPNGCIADSCYNINQPGEGGTTPPPPPGPLPDGGFPDPLEGTSKAATLVVGNFQFTEGPVWIGGKLLFSDTQASNILQLNGTSADVFRSNTNGGNGNAVDSQTRLVTCEGDAKRVTRTTTGNPGPNPNVTAIATMYQDAALNSPNDAIARSDGNVWFTDPDYKGNGNQTQPIEGVYRITPNGGVNRLPTQGVIQKPNGIALSVDNNTLYVVDNGAGAVFQIGLQASGASTGSFTKLVADAPGGDGMAVDDANNLYVACNDGVRVFNKAGQAVGTITVPEQPSNCTFGGTDRRTLYITARTGLYSIVLNVPGLP